MQLVHILRADWETNTSVWLWTMLSNGRRYIRVQTNFQEMYWLLGMRKTRTAALHAQPDGIVEWFNRTLEEHLRKVVHKYQID